MDPDEIQSGSTILLPFMIKNSSASAIFASWDDGGVFSIPYLSRQNKSRQNKVTQGWHVKKPKNLPTVRQTYLSKLIHGKRLQEENKSTHCKLPAQTEGRRARERLALLRALKSAQVQQVPQFSGSSVSGGSHVISAWSAVVISGIYKYSYIGHFRNVRGLGKSMVVFRLFEKLKYSNERSTIF